VKAAFAKSVASNFRRRYVQNVMKNTGLFGKIR
jgi:hypothetical protein